MGACIVCSREALADKNVCKSCFLLDARDPYTEVYPHLWVGRADSKDEWKLKTNGICLDVRDSVTFNGIRKARLDKLVEIAIFALESGGEVLLYCHAGLERSPLAAMYLLHKWKDLDLEMAHKLVNGARPCFYRLYWLNMVAK